jgi:hypothetical protein
MLPNCEVMPNILTNDRLIADADTGDGQHGIDS